VPEHTQIGTTSAPCRRAAAANSSTLPADTAGTKRVGDIAYLPTTDGWLYLTCWPDLATREVVDYAMADHLAEIVVGALDTTRSRDRLQPGRVIHSDHGSEYTSTLFRERTGELGLRESYGRTGSCFDNAASESFWALLKQVRVADLLPLVRHRIGSGCSLQFNSRVTATATTSISTRHPQAVKASRLAPRAPSSVSDRHDGSNTTTPDSIASATRWASA